LTTQISFDPTLFRHQNNFLLKIFFLLVVQENKSTRTRSPTQTTSADVAPSFRGVECFGLTSSSLLFSKRLRNVPEKYRLDEICSVLI